MDMGHLHLVLNHLPVLGIPAVLLLLVWGRARDMPPVVRVALWLAVGLGVVTAAVYFTGEAAEELVEGLPTFQEPLVERHEEVALRATLLVVVTALLAAAALYGLAREGARGGNTLLWLVVIGLTLSTAAVGLTAWTGGPIGHPELRPTTVAGGSAGSAGGTHE